VIKFNKKSNPDIVWVLGSSTNSGKTTVSTALIRYLNRFGCPTVGFKPVAGGKLRDIIDFAVLNYPRIPNSIFGSDGFELSIASPLTAETDVDLVSPWQLIFYRNSDDTVIIRAGSMSLGNVNYFKSSLANNIQNRADIVRINKVLKLPFDKAVLFDHKITDRTDLAPEVQKQAFDALKRKKPSVIVVESAGPFVPDWMNSPRPDHIIFVNDFTIKIFPNVSDIDFAKVKYSNLLETEFIRLKLPSRQINQYYVESKIRAQVTENLLRLLLKSVDD
jgi:predicted P-loop ATPase/GTPase